MTAYRGFSGFQEQWLDTAGNWIQKHKGYKGNFSLTSKMERANILHVSRKLGRTLNFRKKTDREEYQENLEGIPFPKAESKRLARVAHNREKAKERRKRPRVHWNIPQETPKDYLLMIPKLYDQLGKQNRNIQDTVNRAEDNAEILVKFLVDYHSADGHIGIWRIHEFNPPNALMGIGFVYDENGNFIDLKRSLRKGNAKLIMDDAALLKFVNGQAVPDERWFFYAFNTELTGPELKTTMREIQLGGY